MPAVANHEVPSQRATRRTISKCKNKVRRMGSIAYEAPATCASCSSNRSTHSPEARERGKLVHDDNVRLLEQSRYEKQSQRQWLGKSTICSEMFAARTENNSNAPATWVYH